MPSETVTLDATSVDASNVQVLLEDQANGIRLVSHAYPDPEPDYMGVESADTEGSRRVQNRPRDRTIPTVVRCADVTPGDGKMRARITELQQKVAKFNREGGTYKRTLADGSVIVFDVKSASIQIPADWQFLHRDSVEVAMSFLCDPLGWSPEVGQTTENFGSDTAINDFTHDSGSGATVSSNAMRPTSSGRKVLRYGTDEFYDVEVQLKWTSGATVATGSVGPRLKRIDADNYLHAQIVGGATNQLRIRKVVAGVGATVTGGSTSFTPSAATTYYMRFRIEGNLLIFSVFTSVPTATSTPAVIVSTSLTGSDIALFGEGVPGGIGIDWDPNDSANDETIDDLTVTPWQYRERDKPAAVGVVYGVPGSAPALGRLIIDEAAGADQWFVHWGLESRHYGTADTQLLRYEAEALTRQNSADCTLVAVSGASGGTVIRHANLSTSYQAVVIGQMGGGTTSGTAYLTHVGDYEVWGRFSPRFSNSGTVSVALEWSEGDFHRVTQNDDVVLPMESAGTVFHRRPLGLVHLTEPVTGAARWEPRVLAKSTSGGDDVDVDYLYLRPVTEGAGEASAVVSIPSPTVYSARDEFDQSAGSLTGKTAPIGGVWAGAGDADDFTINTSGDTARRTASNDALANLGRVMTVGSAMTACAAQVDVMTDTAEAGLAQGVVLRYADTSNFFTAYIKNTGESLNVQKRVAGATTTILSNLAFRSGVALDAWLTIRTVAFANGDWHVWLFAPGTSPGAPVASGYDADLATGGALASGTAGFRDFADGILTGTRDYDNFAAWVPQPDAAVYSGQSLEIRHNAVIREDSGGTISTRPSSYEGDYCFPLPAGVEGRTNRLLVATHRNDPDTMPDLAIDDTTFRLAVTPRWHTVPQP